MKLNEAPVEIERGGSMIESAFGISEKDSVHIVSILRDKLYSNKILAVVREYSTNAQDAHADAGKKDTPIRVTLPGPLDPTFRVRDFGGGLSEEDIRTVYALYGASTKRNSNEVVGQLGLGCKAAFAYTDKFNIVSWQNGVRKTYIAYIDETRLGKIALVDTAADNEPDGIEIQVPVKLGEFHLFKNEAQNLLPYFRPQPELLGATITPKSYDLSGTLPTGADYGIHFDGSYECNVIMGGIPYRIDANSLVGKVGSDIINLFSLAIDIYVNIGDVDIAANRETLEFTGRTITALKDHLLHITSVVQKEAEDRISQAPTFRAANEMYHQINHSRNNFWRSVRVPTTWNGKKISGHIIQSDSDSGLYEIMEPSRSRGSYKWYNRNRLNADGESRTIISVDVADNWQKKANEWIKATPGISYDRVVAIRWTSSATPADIDQVIDRYGLKEYDFKLLSDCKVVRVRMPRGTGSANLTRSTSHLGTIFRFKEKSLRPKDNSCPSQHWEKALTVGPENKYYVKLEKFKAEFPTQHLNSQELGLMLDACRMIGLDIKDTDLYGVKAAKIDKLDCSWIPLVAEIKKVAESSKMRVELKDYDTYSSLAQQVKGTVGSSHLFPATSPARKLVEIAEATNKTYNSLYSNNKRDHFRSLMKIMNMDLEGVSPTYEVEKYITETQERYPLIAKAGLFPGGQYNRYYGYGSASEKELIPHIIEYVAMVEDKRKKELENELSLYHN